MKYISPILILVLALLAIWFYGKSHKLGHDIDTTQSILEEKEDSIRVVKLENGRLKQEKQAAIIESSNSKLITENYKEVVKDLEENHNVEIRDLHAYYRASITTTGDGKTTIKDTTITINDTTRIFPSIFATDDYLTFRGYWINKNFHYDYFVQDSLSISYHWTKKGMWPFKNRDKLMVSFSSSNPRTFLNSATGIAITDTKKAQFTIGPYVGYGLEGLSFGISLQKPIIRIRL